MLRRKVRLSYERIHSSYNLSRDLNFDRFNIQSLEFFYFNALKLYDFKYIIHNYKKIIFKKIYIFNKRVYNYVLFIDEIITKENPFFYFRGLILN